MEQRIQFCSTADGIRIAYATMGQGPALVYPPPWISHVGLACEWPALRYFFQTLARHHTLVTYDRPGCGLSDRDRTDCSLEAEARTLETVVDHLKLKRFALLGVSLGGPIAIAYAAKHPRRVSHLILFGTVAHGDAIAKEEVKASLLSLVRAHWGFGSRTLADIIVPAGDAADHAWFTRFQRESTTAETAAQLLELLFLCDLSGLIPGLRVPTVVMHREKDRSIPFRLGRELAALLPNARFVPLEGN
ncbi:MAG: alpha/beta hydrolase, partial [Candidatus Neomarinimicrobiota bacterium]